MNTQRLKIKLQLYCGEEIAMGPGKADLLDAIGQSGSISGAARALGMSYRRAWLLVDAMNRCFAMPMVATSPGGKARGGGARITAQGAAMLAHYRALQSAADTLTGGPAWEALAGAMRPAPLAHQTDVEPLSGANP
jgi:molybdate transport system regulatory protein